MVPPQNQSSVLYQLFLLTLQMSSNLFLSLHYLHSSKPPQYLSSSTLNLISQNLLKFSYFFITSSEELFLNPEHIALRVDQVQYYYD